MGLVTGVLDLVVAATALLLAIHLRHDGSRSPGLVIAWATLALADFGWAMLLVTASFLGLVALGPAPAMMGNPPLLVISLFALPFGIFLHRRSGHRGLGVEVSDRGGRLRRFELDDAGRAPGGVGGVSVQVRFGTAVKARAVRCADESPVYARVRVRGPNGFHRTRRVDLCRVRAPRRPDVRFGLLDPGEYTVRVRIGMLGAERTVVVTADRTRALVLKREPGA